MKTPQNAARMRILLTTMAILVVASLSAFANLDVFIELTNIGTLFAFILVCIGIMVLRKRDPGRRRAFRTPLVPLTPILGILICLYLIIGVPAIENGSFVRYGGLPTATWIRFVVWLVLGLVIYFLYGYRHSRLRSRDPHPASSPPPSAR